MNTTPVDRNGTRGTVVTAIRNAAVRSGINFDYLYHQARLESGLNPTAAARTSSARGLYQFLDQTWLATVSKHGAENGLGWAASAITRNSRGRYTVTDPQLRQTIMNLRNDPTAASSMAAAFASDNRDYLTQRLGRPVQAIDLYLAHFLGSAGAVRFLTAHATNPDQSAAQLMPSAAAANRPIFFNRGVPRSVAEVHNVFATRMGLGVAHNTVGGMQDRYAAPFGELARTVPAAPRRAPGMMDIPDPYRMPPLEPSLPGATASLAMMEDGIPSEIMMAAMQGQTARAPRNTYASLAYLTLAQLGG
jgi:hypothetical protein